MKLTPVTAEEFFHIYYKDIGRRKLNAVLLITLEGGRTSEPLLELLKTEKDVDFPVYHIHVLSEEGIPDIVVEHLHPKDLPQLYTYKNGQTQYMVTGTPETYMDMPNFIFKIMS